MAARFFVAAFVAHFAHFAYAGLAQAQAPVAAPYDFAYRVSGDRRVAPVQVFDDGRNTYLQFRNHQTVPAIFSVDGNEERLASYTLGTPYVVVAGTGNEFAMRIGSVSAHAHYHGGAGRTEFPAGAVTPDDDADGALPVAMRQNLVGRALRPPRTDAAASRAPASSMVFEASMADQNMRSVLMRWAKSAGWTFQSEHWTVDVDIPLAGGASFGADFKTAVRQLLASTELSARPLQPCFYSNKVVRVVPLVEQCNRATTATALR